MKTTQHLCVALLSLFLLACASSNSGSVYSRDEARKVQTMKTGVVENVRPVKLEGTRSQIGTAAGAAVGGIAGSSVGEGRGEAVGAVVGAVVGGIAGSALEELVTRKDALEITIQLDHGDTVVIIQEADEIFHAGDKVRLIENNGITRVSH